MAKYTLDFKLAVISRFLQGDSKEAVSRHFDVDPSTVKKWIAAYQCHGIEGIKPLQRWRNHDSEFKESVILYRRKHRLSAREAAAYFIYELSPLSSDGKASTIRAVEQL